MKTEYVTMIIVFVIASFIAGILLAFVLTDENPNFRCKGSGIVSYESSSYERERLKERKRELEVEQMELKNDVLRKCASWGDCYKEIWEQNLTY